MAERRLHLFTAAGVAEELALRDAEMLRRITPEEIRNGAWMHEKKEELAPNIFTMVHDFNSLAQLVPTEVLVEETMQQRAKVIVAYIKIAKKCYELKNYNSLNALLAGLLCTPLYRLKRTWKEVPSKRRRQLTYLTNLMSEEGNWRMYKKEVAKRVVDNATCVIFLGVFLSHVVRYESYYKLKRTSKSSTPPSPALQRKKSMYETFTVLEAITVRQRLQSLRLSQSMGGTRVGGGVGRLSAFLETVVPADKEREMDAACNGVKTILTKQVSGENGLFADSSEEAGEKMGGERLQLLSSEDLSGSDMAQQVEIHRNESGGDLSPDLPELDWSKQVCQEADQRTKSTSRELALTKRGRSLEQLLQACLLDEQEELGLAYSRSRSMPRLTSTDCLQTWRKEDKEEEEGGGGEEEEERDNNLQLVPHAMVNGAHEYASTTSKVRAKSSTSSSILILQSIQENGFGEIGGTSDRKQSASYHQKNGHNSHPQLSNGSVTCTHNTEQNQSPSVARTTSDAPRKSVAPRTSVAGPPRRPRKRYTASDEMPVLQLHLARQQPSTEPSVMLKQYQILSLGYSMALTTSPHIRKILDSFATTSEAHNYRRSYILES